MSARPGLLLLGVLLAAQAAWAQLPGLESYASGDYEEAAQLFAQELANPQLPSAERAQACIYLAASLYALGQVDEARKPLEVLAREHPKQRVDPVQFPPELVALAEVIRQQVESERLLAAREAELQQAREAELRRPPPIAFFLRPEALGLFEALDRQWLLGAGVAFRRESVEGSVRVLLGRPAVIHLQGGVLPGRGVWSPFLGLRASLLPGNNSYGAGPVVGGRVALPAGLVGLLDLGADYFFVGQDDRYRIAVTAQAGLGFDVNLR